MQELEPSDSSKNRIGSGRWDGVHAARRRSLSTTNRLRIGAEGADAGCRMVEVRSAESFVAEHTSVFPNVIKVEVERGHEGAVLDGMRSLLRDRRLRCAVFEVHFGILQQRGESRRPREIQQEMEAQR